MPEYQDDSSSSNELKNARKRRRSSRLSDAVNKKRKIINPAKSAYTDIEADYYRTLCTHDKNRISEIEHNLHTLSSSNVPVRFKILNFDVCDVIKSQAIRQVDVLNQMEHLPGVNTKVAQWVDTFIKIPFGKYSKLGVSNSSSAAEKSTFIKKVVDDLHKEIHGHDIAKKQFTRLIAQWISNKESKGIAVGIHGPMGCGKTSFVKSLCKSLNLPCGFVQLGGISDGSYLEGHGYTYEGSKPGKLIDILIKTQCMNPVIFFDELDKISNTPKGDEIVNMLIHLIDFVQNDKFTDKYFADIDIDLSRCIFVFSYNDESAINPILRDRLIRIETDGYKLKDKIIIASEYMIPEILKEFNIDISDLEFTEEIIIELIHHVDEEKGVRNLKRGIVDIISNINFQRILNNLAFTKYTVCSKDIKSFVQVNKKKGGFSSMYL